MLYIIEAIVLCLPSFLLFFFREFFFFFCNQKILTREKKTVFSLFWLACFFFVSFLLIEKKIDLFYFISVFSPLLQFYGTHRERDDHFYTIYKVTTTFKVLNKYNNKCQYIYTYLLMLILSHWIPSILQIFDYLLYTYTTFFFFLSFIFFSSVCYLI